MENWMDVQPTASFLPGTWQTVIVEGLPAVIFNLNGHFYGLEDCCSHDGGELSSGEVDGNEVICPRHGARFDIQTGAVLSPPAYEDIRRVSVRVNNGMLQAKR